MRKIKILRIIARLNIGGPAIHAVLLTEGLDKAKYESLLVSGSIGQAEGDMSYYAFEKNIKPIFIAELKRELSFLNDIIVFKKIYQLIKKEQPDIIHTHTAKAGFLGRSAGILYNLFHPLSYKRIKLLHTFHGHIFDGYFNKIQTNLFLVIEQLLAIFTFRIVTVSETIKNELISLGICRDDKIKVVPLGFELERLLSIPLCEDRNFVKVGIIGRLAPIKNHRLFLEAAAVVIKSKMQRELRFEIIGDGELKEELQAYVHKLNIASYVDFLGWQKDLVKIYSDLDIVALTSINEGTPVSLIEAMASGKVIVATDVGGVRDLLGREININSDIKINSGFKVLERGMVVKNKDFNSFAAALIFILQRNELRRNICILARNFARNRFTKNRLIEDIEKLYDNVLS